jgi:hypothetical protein
MRDVQVGAQRLSEYHSGRNAHCVIRAARAPARLRSSPSVCTSPNALATRDPNALSNSAGRVSSDNPGSRGLPLDINIDPQGPPVSSSGPPATSPQSTQDDAVTGTVTWPGGHPAAGASVYFYNHDPGFTASGWSHGEYQVQQLPTDGSYSLVGCPCGDLTAYLYMSSTPGAGRDCWIIMRTTAMPIRESRPVLGDVVNWQALNMLCSPTWYTSDQSTVQSQAAVIDPSQNGGDYSTSAGTWQAAELRTSGCGSGG